MSAEKEYPKKEPAHIHPKARPQKAASPPKRKSPQTPGRMQGVPGAAASPRPECILIDGTGSCPEWEGILPHYPMINSVQREDFPEHGVSFAYLAHFYRTADTAEESARAQEEFEAFFRAIGYTYDHAGNYEDRWFEGIGVRVTPSPGAR